MHSGPSENVAHETCLSDNPSQSLLKCGIQNILEGMLVLRTATVPLARNATRFAAGSFKLNNCPSAKFRFGQQQQQQQQLQLTTHQVKMAATATGTQPQFSKDLLFRQLFDRDSCTYTYLLADIESKEAILIDPVIDLAERDAQSIKDLGLKLKYVINTHMHADHITGTGLLKKLIPQCQSMISKASSAKADLYLVQGDKVQFGRHVLEVRATPGHTNGCVTYVFHEQGCAFTGDALLIRGCGRTDFQEGDPSTLYDSVWTQILSLPDNFRLFPAHDYKGQSVTSVCEEKALNPRLSKPKEEFVEIMENLGLPYPRKIDESLPANKVCGLYDLPERFQEKFKN